MKEVLILSILICLCLSQASDCQNKLFNAYEFVNNQFNKKSSTQKIDQIAYVANGLFDLTQSCVNGQTSKILRQAFPDACVNRIQEIIKAWFGRKKGSKNILETISKLSEIQNLVNNGLKKDCPIINTNGLQRTLLQGECIKQGNKFLQMLKKISSNPSAYVKKNILPGINSVLKSCKQPNLLNLVKKFSGDCVENLVHLGEKLSTKSLSLEDVSGIYQQHEKNIKEFCPAQQ